VTGANDLQHRPRIPKLDCLHQRPCRIRQLGVLLCLHSPVSLLRFDVCSPAPHLLWVPREAAPPADGSSPKVTCNLTIS
jgi:hypothetical protein